MTDKVIENNQVIIMGKIVSDFEFSHEIFGEGFYMVDVEVARLSDSYDIIPLMVSERLLDVEEDYKGAYVCVSGQFRSYNRHEERKNRLILSVFAREIEFVEELEESSKTNQIYLDGYICKEPVLKDSSGTGNCRRAPGRKPAVRKIRLYPLYLLGTQRPFRRRRLQRGRALRNLGQNPEP